MRCNSVYGWARRRIGTGSSACGLRHAVYAEELGQHAGNPAGRLSDALEDRGVVYLVAT